MALVSQNMRSNSVCSGSTDVSLAPSLACAIWCLAQRCLCRCATGDQQRDEFYGLFLFKTIDPDDTFFLV